MEINLNEVNNLRNVVQAMKSSGQSSDLIVKRISQNPNISPDIKSVFDQSQVSGMQDKAVNDFLSLPLKEKPLVSGEELKTPGIVGNISEALGAEKLGRFLTAKTAMLSPEHRANLEALKKAGMGEEARTLETGGISGKELAGSAAQTIGTAALPFIRALSAPALATRIKAGAAVGAGMGTAGAAQSDGNLGEGAILGAGLGAVLPVAGAAIRYAPKQLFTIPERSYNYIFKTAKDDLASKLATEFHSDLKQTNPQAFQKLVDSGKIKTDSNGNPVIDPTLAQEVMEKGLKGNPTDMFKFAYGKTLELEGKVIDALKGQKIDIGNRNKYLQIIGEIKQQYGDPTFSPTAKKANELFSKLKKTKGDSIDANLALEMRRFLDDTRQTSSFRANPSLSPREETFKGAADSIRSSLSRIDGLKDIMNDYRIYIQAKESLINFARRTGDAPLIGSMDSLLGGIGLATGHPATLAASLVRNALVNPSILTNLSQGIRSLREPLQKAGEKIVPDISRRLRNVPEEKLNLLGKGLKKIEPETQKKVLEKIGRTLTYPTVGGAVQTLNE